MGEGVHYNNPLKPNSAHYLINYDGWNVFRRGESGFIECEDFTEAFELAKVLNSIELEAITRTIKAVS